ncbi:MAG: alpha-galactosidase [Thermoproteota archaeon]
MKPTAGEMAKAHEWVDAKLIRASEHFFSFSYGGQSSEKLLASWKLERETNVLSGGIREHCLTYTDVETGLRLKCTATEYSEFPAAEWVLYFKNMGKDATPIMGNILPLDLTLNCKDDPILHYSRGALCSPSDFEPLCRKIGSKTRFQLKAGGGRSSSETLPFFNLELAGEGVVMAIGWTGEWFAGFSRSGDGKLRLQAGMARTHLRLNGGEEIRSSRILLLFWLKDRMRGHNLLRQFILAHHRPSVNGKPLEMPILVTNWGGTPASAHLAKIRSIIAHDLPVEYYWIDAEWFGTGEWWKNAGNWEVKRDLYPEGFKPISEALHQAGRKLLLWFEPERVCEGTPWYSEHADWLLRIKEGDEVYSWPHYTDMADPQWVVAESNRNQIKKGDRLFNLGDPEARRFLTDFISRKISEFGIDCFRHDANIAPLKFWMNADPDDRQGVSEIRYVEGLYSFWSELLKRHPSLIIDNCASGGRRIDLESIGLSTVFSRTDYIGDIVSAQCHTYGLMFWVPLQTGGGLGVNIVEADDYTFRSTWSSGLVFELNVKDDQYGDESIFNEVKRKLNQYLAIQKFFYGDYYPLTQYTQARDAWMAYQLDRPDLGAGLVVILKRPLSSFVEAVFQLNSLEPAAEYETVNLDTGEMSVASGKELMETGLRVRLVKKPDSALILYSKKVNPPQ